jgi:predicted nuclease of restriction endonuclease-like (RecB) superfamily
MGDNEGAIKILQSRKELNPAQKKNIWDYLSKNRREFRPGNITNPDEIYNLPAMKQFEKDLPQLLGQQPQQGVLPMPQGFQQGATR